MRVGKDNAVQHHGITGASQVTQEDKRRHSRGGGGGADGLVTRNSLSRGKEREMCKNNKSEAKARNRGKTQITMDFGNAGEP